MFHFLRWLTPVLLLALAPVARAADFVPLGPNYPSVARFSLTERSGQPVTLDDLHGKVWVAHFFFKCCTQGCPQTTAGMEELHRALAGRQDVRLVSITLDPETDTPDVLREYADRYHADPQRWLFLTGDEKAIHTLSEKSFMSAVIRTYDADPGKRVQHAFRLFVVDRQGRLRGYIRDGRDPEQVKLLEREVRLLADEPWRLFFPALNACLNGMAGVLLVLGYLAIRRRREGLHKVCMLAALAVSTCFLTTYLYYHLSYPSTRFQGQGWIRPLYFGMLVSHIVLAVLVTPLALWTAYVGIRDRRPRHVRLARWTLPLWLYVSVTGVLVYWMLYRLYPPV